jgi:hypothetical protein
MTAFKKWCWAAVITGAVFIIVGIVGLATGVIPPIVIVIIQGVGFVLDAIGLPLLAKPTPPTV